MSNTDLSVIILAAGKGTRMGSDLPKVMHPIAGRPMVLHLAETINGLNPKKTILVLNSSINSIPELPKQFQIAIQEEPLGTGDAVAIFTMSV